MAAALFGIVLVLLVVISLSSAFMPSGSRTSSIASFKRSLNVRMEYIPDGLTKAQWDQIKKREEEELKKKGNLGALGATKFKSRSFEAWQKAGAKHLFPSDPKTTPYEERPYMQRKNGDWEGKDLNKLGLSGAGQGAAAKRLEVDNIYDGYKAAGKLESVSIFGGAKLPWTSEAAAAINKSTSKMNEAAKEPRGVAGKQLSPEEFARLKANLIKPVTKETEKKQQQVQQAAAPAEPKKKLFGLF